MMKAIKNPALIGAAVIAAIGLAGAAAAEIVHRHVLTIRLPDGALEQIRYVGDTPPVVRLQPGLAQVTAFPADDVFDAEFAFEALERMSAQMDREASALLQQAPGLTDSPFDSPSDLVQVDLGKAPPAMRGYSMISTVSGGRVCTRTTHYGRFDDSGRLMAVTRTSGDCGAPASPPATSSQTAPPPETDNTPLLQRVSAKL